MAFQVKWTIEVEETFESIVAYLENHRTDREVVNFMVKTNHLPDQIRTNPKMFRSSVMKSIRIGVITYQTSLFYQINESENTIVLLSFWDNRKNRVQRKY